MREALMRGCRFIRLPEWHPDGFAVLCEERRDGSRWPIAQMDCSLMDATAPGMAERKDWEEVPWSDPSASIAMEDT